MKKTVLVSLLCAALLLLAACGRAPAPADSPAESAAATEDGQNPVMNFVGLYHAEDSTEALVEAEGMENAKITVTWAGSPWFHNQAVMSGRFDPETLTMAFDGSTLTEYSYNSDGSVKEEKTSNVNDGGHAVFNPADNTLSVTEEFESGNIETVYTWGPAPGMKYVSDPDHYAPVTAMDKAEVETVVGFEARTAYLSQNWYALAEMIRYPITINGTELADADAFLGYMMDKTVAEEDWEAMYKEDFLDMFVNGEGICMGSGQIWLNDPNYMTDAEPRLEIIAISGIIDEAGQEAAETNSMTAYRAGGAAVRLEGSDGVFRSEDGTLYYLGEDGVLRARGYEDLYINDLAARAAAPEGQSGAEQIARQDGERFEASIIMEGMEEIVRYEHVRNDGLGFEMDYDYESLARRSEADRECFVSIWDAPEQPENYLELTRSAEDAESVAAAIAEELSKKYEISRDDSFMLGRAGRCIHIDASADIGGLTMPDQLQAVYIIPTDDGCRIAREHYAIEASEGFGRRFRYMMDSFLPIAG